MPQIVVAVAAAAAGAGAVSALGALATTTIIGSLTIGTVVSGLVSTGVGLLGSQLLAKSGNQPSFTQQATGLSTIIRSSIEAHKVIYGRMRTSGPLTFYTTSDTAQVKNTNQSFSENTKSNQFFHCTLALAAHEVEEIETIYLGETALSLDADNYATNTEFVRSDGTMLVRAKKHLGESAQTADQDLINEVPLWTAEHRGRGIAYIYVRLQFDTDKFPDGIPQIRAIVKGKKVYDPRSTLTEYSNNWALCVRDYLTSSQYGNGASSDEIDDDSVIAAANISEESITLLDGSTQDRYTCNGIVDTSIAKINVLKALVSAGIGVVTYTQGKYKVFAGAYDIPTIEIDDDWIRDGITVSARPPKNELFNGVRGVYIDPDKEWQPTDFAPIINDTYVQQDGGEEIYQDTEFPFTTNPEASQRMAAILLQRARQGIIAEIPLNMRGIQLEPWLPVMITNTHLGWSQKVFRITKWEFTQDGGTNISVQEDSAASYDWEAANATVADPAPDTNLPSATFVEPPGNPQVVEELYSSTQGSGIKTSAIVTWAASPSAFLQYYLVEYKLIADTEYQFAGTPDETTMTIFDLAPGFYDFKVSAFNTLGVQSEPAITPGKEIFGLTAPPSDITGFALKLVNEAAHLQWDTHPDLDVKIGGTFEVRYTPELSGVSWSSALSKWENIPGSTNIFPIEILENGTWFIKAIDSTGHESINAASIINTATTMIKYNALANLQEDPGFTGTKTNLIVDSGIMRLDGAGLFDDEIGNFDDASGLFDAGGGSGFASSGTYEFSTYIDAGKVVEAKITSQITGLVYDATDTFDERAGLFDDQLGLFDGDDIGNITVQFFVAQTDDDPSGSPVWSDWIEFKTINLTARAWKFKIEITSENSALNIDIDTLRVSVDLPDIMDSGSVTTSSGGFVTVTFGKTFQAAPDVGYAIESAASGDRVDWQNLTADDVEIRVLDSGGSAVVRDVFYIAKGY